MKIWKERHIYYEEQKAVITPNETHDGVMLTLEETAEINGDKRSFSIYLTYGEAIDLAAEIVLFVQDERT